MPEVKTHAPGTFCWMDLGTTDAAAAKEFYAKALGWEFHDTEMPDAPPYTMVHVGEKEIGGLYELSPEMKEMGIPAHWLSYISVEDCDAATDRAEAAGAEVKMGPHDVMDVGRMTVIQDPTGAVFAVWQAKSHGGASLVNEVGSVCWNELMTDDVAKAKEFYSSVFGYTMVDQPMGDTSYTMLTMGDKHCGGMMAIQPEMGPVPPHWMIYVSVAECDATMENVKEAGGNVLAGGMDVPGVGRMAVCQDPQGAVFSVIKLTNG